MHFLFALGHREGLAAIGRDEIDLGSFVFRVGIGIVVFPGGQLALGEECNPSSVGGPLRLGIVAGLGQLNQRPCFAIIVIEPEIAAENLLIPVGALGGEDDGISVG